MSIKTSNRKHNINFCFLIYLLVLLFISCKKNHSKEFLFSKTDNSNFYEIHYFKNKIILINHSFVDNVIYKDTSIFIKKKEEYFSNNKGTTNDREFLMMSNKNDTVYEYKNMGNIFSYRISKNKNGEFKATSVNNDSLKFKVKTNIYYNDRYNIFMIEEFLNGKISQWKKTIQREQE
jgi:hypothetical protein